MTVGGATIDYAYDDGTPLTGGAAFHRVKIYTRWTASGDAAQASVAAKAVSDIPEGFSEHTDDITLDGAGTLEYFTRVSNTNSPLCLNVSAIEMSS